ncbi:oxygenase MpaB family protein [Nocardioides bruguierae]|uniref:DUF2236 domain-containing protein n=1 Tax=Nocardioides bruguierae TaxID=2945102 RepID=A0A9X2IF00_9ACTN|nr:oxygenase MpaB family protein [Nocardioides bruguierae]MCL8024166.1 DUF2236 domain-containing protein [Nocardioides bruguierae]MCM0619869.1 DUF2236 domain-containing protein [Nocardioides bruguierae]
MITQARARLGEALFTRVAGPDGPRNRDRIHTRPGPRWFEPGSPITRVHGDASMFVGGVRALLLQTLHPAAMQAVADHSGYRGDLWGRLARTSTFLATTTFGHADDARTAVETVRRIHDRVTGTLPDGTAYAAGDPHLLAWVHAAEVDSFLLAHQVYGERPLTPAECDTYLAQAAVVARALGVLDPPTDRASLAATLGSYRVELRGTPAAREAARFLLLHPPIPLAARVPYAALSAAGVGLLPAWTRPPLRLPWAPVSERTVVRLLGSGVVGGIRWALSGQRVGTRSPEQAPEQSPEQSPGQSPGQAAS